ncbi:MAG: DJ-1/PfpI family protein [Terracidiphilus sp.]
MTEQLKPGETFRVAMLVYPDLTQLDLAGPQEVFSKVPGVDVRLYWKTLAPLASNSGLQLIPTHSFADDTLIDLLFVPGGPGQVELMDDEEVLGFLRRTAVCARYITAVCTGSLLLGAAGLLDGYRATTHWLYMENLAPLGAIAVEERVVIDRNRITGGGVTAGIDFALTVLAELWGESIARSVQLLLEYDPHPPFDSGSPRNASPDLQRTLQARMRPFMERRLAASRAAGARLHT